MCGIFAYLNHLTPKTRKEILDVLIKVRGELPFAILVSIFSSFQGLHSDLASTPGACLLLENLWGKL